MNDEPMLEVVVFNLASERCAVESVYVREVHPVTEVTPLPCTPPCIGGVVNVRGDILAVVDLAVLFDLKASRVEPLTHVIVVEHADMLFGILADASIETATLSIGELGELHPSRGSIPGACIRGITKDGLVVLDLPGIATDPRLLVSDHVE
jgi:purine-binding chemotaxis protein CheW